MLRVVTVMGVIVALVVVSAIVLDRATTNDGDSVTIIGDSITEWGSPALTERFGGTFDLEVIGHGGFRTDQLQPEAAAAAATQPVQIIINAGSNDALQHRPWGDTAASLEQMVALFPDAECVHVVTLNTHMRDRDGEPQQGADEINAAIRALPETHPNVSIIEWAEIVDDDLADHPPVGTLTPDTVHPGPAGERVLLGAYDDALQRCGRPWKVW